MNNNDEIINKYVDSDLNEQELDKIEILLKTDTKFNTMIKVHKFVHNSLHEIDQKSAPAGFTELIMEKIIEKLSTKYQKNYMFRFVISVLIIFILISLFSFFYFLGDIQIIKNASDITLNFSDKILPSFSSIIEILNSNIFKTITGLLGFVILVIFYFNYNTHKQLKDTLKKL